MLLLITHQTQQTIAHPQQYPHPDASTQTHACGPLPDYMLTIMLTTCTGSYRHSTLSAFTLHANQATSPPWSPLYRSAEHAHTPLHITAATLRTVPRPIPCPAASSHRTAHHRRTPQVAQVTLRVLLGTVPRALPGVVFLSGGQSEELATTHMAALGRLAAERRAAGKPL